MIHVVVVGGLSKKGANYGGRCPSLGIGDVLEDGGLGGNREPSEARAINKGEPRERSSTYLPKPFPPSPSLPSLRTDPTQRGERPN